MVAILSKPQSEKILIYRLEELLIQFPPEEVEARRWEKIATALGNRTLQQVRMIKIFWLHDHMKMLLYSAMQDCSISIENA